MSFTVNRGVLWAVLTLLTAGSIFGQVTGRISGSVVDASGAPVPDARVELFLPGGQTAILATNTTGDGLYTFIGVRPEFYDLVIEAKGFLKVTVRQVKVDPLRETNVPVVTLEIAAVQQTIEVAANIENVQVNNAEVSTTIGQEQVRLLPVQDRQVINLITTQAGVSDGRGPTVINGLRTSYSTVTLDGINIQDNFLRSNSLSYIPNRIAVDQISEMTISTSNAAMTLAGGASGVTMVTPSGSNDFRGNLYWYNRNNYFAANEWFNNADGVEKPFLNQNQLGGSVGGPIFRDKLLFYANYEALRLREQSLANRTILTSDARNGIFTYRDSSGAAQRVNILQVEGVNMDPLTQQLLQRVPGPENINNFRVGDSRADLLRNTGGYSFNVRDNTTYDNLTAKLDYNLSVAHVFSGSFLWNREITDRPDLDTSFNRVPTVFNDNSSKLLSIGWRWSPGPTFTNEVRGGFNLAPGSFANSEEFPPFILDRLTTYFSYPINSRLLPQGRATDTYQFLDNAGWIRGKHNLQFGFQAMEIRTAPYNDAGIIPTYSIGISPQAPAGTGLTAADLPGIGSQDLNQANNMLAQLAGYVSRYTQTFNIRDRNSGFVPGQTNLRHFTFGGYSGFVQDTWRVHPRVSLVLGLRYDYYTRVDEQDALVLMPEPAGYLEGLLGNTTLNFAGGAVGRPWYGRDLNNFAPNVGVAWDVFGNGKTAVRAGYGISYVNDDTIAGIRNSLSTSGGLSLDSTGEVHGRLTGSLPPIPTPAFQVPRTAADNQRVDALAALAMPDPNLRTPYVQQWNFGIQQEVKGFILEARYVGNKVTKALRAFDLNQVVIRENGFLEDFIRARQNGELARAATGAFNPAYTGPGTQPLTIFPRLASGGLLTNATVRNLIETGQAGELAYIYQINRLNGPFQFFRNPFTLGANVMTNYSNSSYNALQVELRRRVAHGLHMQANYTYGKVLSDALGDTSARFEAFLDMANPSIERARAPYDITHAIKANFVYELPFGRGKRWSYAALDRVIGGWILGGKMVWQSGSPFSILSSRGTVNRGGRSTLTNTAIATADKDQLDELVGKVFMTGEGPYFVSPTIIAPDGRGAAPDGRAPFSSQIFFNPGPGELGQLQRRMFSGPWTFNLDVSALKRFAITERQSLEFRMEAFNFTNTPSFYVGDETVSASTPRFNINNTTFGRFTDTFYSSRVFQFGFYYRF